MTLLYVLISSSVQPQAWHSTLFFFVRLFLLVLLSVLFLYCCNFFQFCYLPPLDHPLSFVSLYLVAFAVGVHFFTTKRTIFSSWNPFVVIGVAIVVAVCIQRDRSTNAYATESNYRVQIHLLTLLSPAYVAFVCAFIVFDRNTTTWITVIFDFCSFLYNSALVDLLVDWMTY